MKKNQKIPDEIKGAIKGVFELLKSGDLPEAIAKAVFPKESKPCSAWSFSNRLFVAIDYIQTKYAAEYKAAGKEAGKFLFSKLGEAFAEMDYRGKNQWKEAKRNVESGSTPSYILAPNMVKFIKRSYTDDNGKKIILKKDEKAPEGKDEQSEELRFPQSFRGVPVFSVSDTFGKPVVYKQLKLPELPFMPVAKFLGITVVPKSFTGDGYGSFSPTAKVIQLATPNQTTFFHELSHAVDNYILSFKGKQLKGGQHVDQELVAQFSANVIAYIRGYEIKESTAYTKKYIESYAGKDAENLVIKLIARIERIVEFIVNFKEAKSPNRQAEEIQGEPKSETEKLADKPTKSRLRKSTVINFAYTDDGKIKAVGDKK
jgi:hypothetical protein